MIPLTQPMPFSKHVPWSFSVLVMENIATFLLIVTWYERSVSSAVDVLALGPVSTWITNKRKTILFLQRMELASDWSKSDHQEGIFILGRGKFEY